MINISPACLVLADGSVFEGEAIGAQGEVIGELVFNTSQTGYQEILTDPSYARQIVMLTTSHVGNTGCNQEDMESNRVWASGLVIQNSTPLFSNYRAQQSLSSWLIQQDVVAIAGVDTRALTERLREFGTMSACITTDVNNLKRARELANGFSGLKGIDLAKEVSRQTIERWYEGRGAWASKSQPLQFHVVVYDFGVKASILKILHDLGCYLTLVPAQTPVQEVLALNPDGIVFSNGPGDPQACDYAIHACQQALEHNIPIFGICLGFQILGLACGAQSQKMKFGHHGGNHPVLEVQNLIKKGNASEQRVFITSQNHGFSIDEATLPDCLVVTHRSLFDQSLQGMMHQQKPAFGFQGHPEAGPGPHDIEDIFEYFIALMINYRNLEKKQE